MPTHVQGPEIKQDRIRLRNALGEADQLLEQAGLRRAERDHILSAGRSLLDDLGFWQHQGNGLALFLAGDLSEEVRMPMSVPERVTVAEVFHLRPLLPSLEPDRTTVLAFSRKSCRLFEATRFGISELEADLPSSIVDVNWFVDRQNELQQHPSGAGSHSFHGHEANEAQDEDLRRFLRALATQVRAAIGEDPLILVAVDELSHAYIHEVGDRHQIEGTVALNPDHLNSDQIHAAAFNVISERLSRDTAAARARLDSALGENRAVVGLDAVLKAAASGQVDELFLADNAPERWGRFEPASMTIEQDGDRQPGSMDLVDRAAVETIRLGGSVRVLDDMPPDTEIAAVVRF
jgi:hypothetical protein